MSEVARKFTLYLARITFALLLPMYLVWLILISHFTSQRAIEIEKRTADLDLVLDNLEHLHADKVFLHALLQKNFRIADQSKQPEIELEKRLTAFRRRFGKNLRFIVYDAEGAINQHLTEEKRFKYVLKSMFEVMVLLRQYFVTDPFAEPGNIDLVNQRLNLLRGYFGRYLLPDQLFLPLQPGYLGSCLTTSNEKEKKLLWYYPGDNFSLVCFIDSSLLKRQLGPHLLIQRFNSGRQPEKLAFVQTLTYRHAGLPSDPALASQLLIEVRNFESYAVSRRQSRDFLVNIRQVSHDLIILSYVDKKDIIMPAQSALAVLLSWLRWLIVGAFFLYCFSLRYQQFYLSVQHKMLLLFLFANGLPFLVLVSTGCEFFGEKKKELIVAAHQESLRILREFDLRFPEVANSLADKLNRFIDERNRLYGRQKWPDHELVALKSLLREIDPQEAALYHANGEQLFYITNSSDQAHSIGANMMLRALSVFNKRRVEVVIKRNTTFQKMTADDLMLHYFISILDRISILGAGTSERHIYLKFLGDQSQADMWGIIGVSWDRPRFIQAFAPERLQNSAQAILPRHIAIMDKKTGRVFSLAEVETPFTRKLMRQTSSRKLMCEQDVKIGGQRWLLSAISGNEMAEAILVAFYPQTLIENRIVWLKIAIALIGLMVFVVLWQIVRMFSRRLLVPVESLAAGISCVRSRDFRFRVDYQSEDELGKLVKVFNQTMKDMQDLALGTSVQVSLLPAENYRRGNLSLFARSLFMSKMGGDYYDYFDLPNDRLGIFFGDVAGHGIPAAMIMSMAKAAVSSLEDDYAGPADLLSRTNVVLLHLKQKNWRRMMTAQAFEIDCAQGNFRFANAGHCFPYLVAADGASARSLEIIGFPLGSASKKAYEECSGKLEPGMTLVCYSDGIVEAVNSQDEVFGYSRFERLLVDAWSEDLEVYWQNIMAEYNRWAVNQDDDLTFLLARIEGGGE